jgi:hypothetical protein
MEILKKITWSHLTQMENGGHDAFLPSLTNAEVRYMMKSIRDSFTEGKLFQPEAPRFTMDDSIDEYEATVPLIQPEAPIDSRCFRRWCTASNLCIDCQPEAPKGQEDEDTGNCTVCNGPVYYGSRHSKCGRLENDLGAANARIAELASELHNAHAKIVEKENERLCAVLDWHEANARADAAERRLESLETQLKHQGRGNY